MLSGRGLCIGLIIRPEEPIKDGVPERNHEASIMRPLGALVHTKKGKRNKLCGKLCHNYIQNVITYFRILSG